MLRRNRNDSPMIRRAMVLLQLWSWVWYMLVLLVPLLILLLQQLPGGAPPVYGFTVFIISTTTTRTIKTNIDHHHHHHYPPIMIRPSSFRFYSNGNVVRQIYKKNTWYHSNSNINHQYLLGPQQQQQIRPHVRCYDSFSHYDPLTVTEPTETTTPINGSGSTIATSTVENINVGPNSVSPQDTPGLQQQQRPDTKIVVVMNANARGVSNQTIQMAQDVFGIESVVVTHTIPDVYRTLQPLLVTKPFHLNTTTDHWDCRRPPMIIVTMGGDGTLATTIQTMCQILLEQQHAMLNPNNSTSRLSLSSSSSMIMSQLPIIAYVPLGTGNAVGSVVGCSYHSDNRSSARNSASPSSTAEKSSTISVTTTSPSSSNIVAQLYHRIQSVFHFVLHQLRRWFQSRSSLQRLRRTLQHIVSVTTTNSTLPITELPMVEISNTNFTDLCFFAGAGFDSLMLNDFKNIKQWSQRTGMFTGILSSVVGYVVTLLVQTLPKTVLRSSHIVHVQVTTNQLNNTYWIDHRRGDFVQPCTTPIVYHGTTGIIAGSTVPYYGGKLRLFPFARISSDKLHLRIGRIHPLIGFFNLYQIFSGTYRDFSKTRFGVLDFIGNDFTINMSSAGKDAVTNNFPLQHSGESMGPVSSFRLRVIDTPVRFLNLLPDR